MKHRIGFNKLSRKDSHRKAMTRNMVTSVFKYERIKTTKAKALEIRRKAEKMITRAKVDSVHNRRIIGRDIKDAAVLAKLFTDIAPRFIERKGGYTRILKLGRRLGDAAEIVFLELVVRKEKDLKNDKKDSDKKDSDKKDSDKKDSDKKDSNKKEKATITVASTSDVADKKEKVTVPVVAASDAVENPEKSQDKKDGDKKKKATDPVVATSDAVEKSEKN